jgi:hypothetical protein
VCNIINTNAWRNITPQKNKRRLWGNCKPIFGSTPSPLATTSSVRPGPQRLSSVGEFCSLFRLLFYSVFFEMVKWRLHIKITIRSSLPYLRSGGACSASGGPIESCSWFRRFSCSLVWILVSLFRYTIVIIGDGFCSFYFGLLARQLLICLLQQMNDSFHNPKSVSLRRLEMCYLFVWREAQVNKFGSRRPWWQWRTSLGLYYW